MVTIKDISKECGVSPATVSKALNGYGDVAKDTVARVMETAKRLHYMPNAAARALKTSTSHSIGVIFQDDTDIEGGLTHEYFSVILNNAKIEAESRGYDITFINRNFGDSYLEHCRYRNFDGVLVVCADFTAKDMFDLAGSDFPLVSIDFSYDSRSNVMSDNVSGTYSLVKYLVSKGHRRIAFIHGEDTSVTKKRLTGFYKAMDEEGIDVPDEYVIEGIYHDPKSGGLGTRKLLGLPHRPTAIMYSDDISFLGGRTEIVRHGLSIPDDISVVGYDGIKLASMLRPELTTYNQDAKKIGRLSMAKLIDQIENKKTCEIESILVKGELYRGNTVRDLNKK
ncbi:MAG: LacI family transcriptional regulator [Lachnospiraceae bacterium]|nr:LacI family transcriptional regulator [Lachnospiraceae bacterium]